MYSMDAGRERDDLKIAYHSISDGTAKDGNAAYKTY